MMKILNAPDSEISEMTEINERRSPPPLGLAGAIPRPKKWLGWIALPVLSILALLAQNRVAPWIFMWLVAAAIFFGCKWLTFWRARMQLTTAQASSIGGNSHFGPARVLGYFFAWPGMDAVKFLAPRRRAQIPVSADILPAPSGILPDRSSFAHEGEGPLIALVTPSPVCGRMSALPEDFAMSIPRITFVFAKIFLGAFLLFGAARLAPQPPLAGWIGMIGLILMLHFGLFDLASIGWRVAGVEVDPIMDAPLRSTSLGEFWGRRWNGAFNRLALDFVFRPLARQRGGRRSRDAATRSRRSSTLHFPVAYATLAAFLVSGLIHELVISLPANDGYGLPTAYFLLQGSGILLQHSRPNFRGRFSTILIAAGPVFFLFHPPFVRQVILPFMQAIHAL
jgi:hypothetical protein